MPILKEEASLWRNTSVSVVFPTYNEKDSICQAIEEFFAAATRAGIRTHVVPYPLAQANEALEALRGGRLNGAAVLTI